MLRYYDLDWTLVSRHYGFSWAGKLSPMAAVDDDGLRYLMSTTDVLGRHLYVHRDYEQAVMHAALGLLEDRSGRRPFLAGRTFLDVGANLGSSVIPALKRFGAARGIAFEPAPANYDILRCNLILNGVDAVVEAHRMALSDHDGDDELELSFDNSGDHRIRIADGSRDGEGFFREETRSSVTVPTARLDTLVDQGRVDASQLGLVWVDVQGHEAQVLTGADTLLSTDHDIAFVIEFWPYGLRRAGGLDALCRLVADRFDTIIDVRAAQSGDAGAEMPAAAIGELVDTYDGISFTDLILL